MTEVSIIVIRHGQKESGVDNDIAQLTPKGRGQVREAGADYLPLGGIVKTLSSSLDRAAETAELGAAQMQIDPPRVERCEALGYIGLPDHEYPEGLKQAAAKKAAGEVITVANWMSWLPQYMAQAIPRFENELMTIARELASEHGDGAMALIGSHSPLSEILTPEPETTPALGEAGIVLYTFEVDNLNSEVKMTDFDILFEGF